MHMSVTVPCDILFETYFWHVFRAWPKNFTVCQDSFENCSPSTDGRASVATAINANICTRFTVILAIQHSHIFVGETSKMCRRNVCRSTGLSSKRLYFVPQSRTGGRETSITKFIMCSRHEQLAHVIWIGPHWATTSVWQKATVVSKAPFLDQSLGRCACQKRELMKPAHNTVKLLQRETPNFLSFELWSSNIAEFNPSDYKAQGIMQQHNMIYESTRLKNQAATG